MSIGRGGKFQKKGFGGGSFAIIPRFPNALLHRQPRVAKGGPQSPSPPHTVSSIMGNGSKKMRH